VVAMANVAQLCNNLHSLYLAGGEHFVETPNYHVFDMFQTHQGAEQIHTTVCCASQEREGFQPMELLSASASRKNGKLTITLANLHLKEAQRVKLTALGGSASGRAVVTTLHHADVHACNTFEAPQTVVPTQCEMTLAENAVIEVPAAGIVSIVIDQKAE